MNEIANNDHAGGCLCGAVRFLAVGDPLRVGICHCSICQKNVGTPYYVYAVYSVSQVTIEGALKNFRAMTIDRRFCPQCGSLVCFEAEGESEIELAYGVFDEPPPFTPQYELWSGQRPDWLSAIPGAHQYAGNREDAS